MALDCRNESRYVRAMPPEPIIPTVLLSSRDRYLTPSPAPPATRTCCRTPSLIIATGSPVRALKRNSRPQNVPGCRAYLFSRMLPYSRGQATMSESIRAQT